MTDHELDSAVQRIVEDDPDEFVRWCNSFSGNKKPDTIVQIIEQARNRIKEEFKLSDEDLFK